MSEEELRLRYALAKQVPDMRDGVALHTNHGEVTLYGRDAERVAALVQRVLEVRLRRLEREAGRG